MQHVVMEVLVILVSLDVNGMSQVTGSPWIDAWVLQL